MHGGDRIFFGLKSSFFNVLFRFLFLSQKVFIIFIKIKIKIKIILSLKFHNDGK